MIHVHCSVCFIFQVYQKKIVPVSKGGMSLLIYPPSLTFAQTWTLKKSMVSVRELSFPTLGIICWRWCSDLWVFDGFCGVNHDPPHTAACDGCHNHQLVILRSPDGFCNLCNSPKGEEDDAQKNEQHLSAGFFLPTVSWEHFTCGRRRCQAFCETIEQKQ